MTDLPYVSPIGVDLTRMRVAMNNDGVKCDWSQLPKIPKAVVGDSTPVRKLKPLEVFVHEAALVMDDVAAPIAGISDKVVNIVWNGLAPIVGPPFRCFLRCVPPVLVFVFLIGVCHVPLLFAILVACGISITDIFRHVGLVGPKRKDKDGKEIDDWF